MTEQTRRQFHLSRCPPSIKRAIVRDETHRPPRNTFHAREIPSFPFVRAANTPRHFQFGRECDREGGNGGMEQLRFDEEKIETLFLDKLDNPLWFSNVEIRVEREWWRGNIA
mmetsp:Transcript_9638/g.19688  ORF Transcript_9638/g.19688 Transcript_9638/m.19688 type:complete len:112 (+) Transcript_9638:420-755(+)